VNNESDVHHEKEYAPKNSTDAGTQIDCNDEEPENDLVAISDRSDWNSNAIN
jgi:hypothetical protein